MPKTTGVQTFNFVRQNSSQYFQDIVPTATLKNIVELKDILFNDNYEKLLNEFVSNLVNRIALTIIRNKSTFNNPLAIFKKGSVPLGTDIQDIYENPAKAEAYEYSNEAMAKLLTITDPDTGVAYYRLNRKELYTKTIGREGLQNAFISWDDFESYIGGITNSLYSGNYIDEFKYTKLLIDGAYAQNKTPVEVINPIIDKTSGKTFVKKAREYYSKFRFPSDKYNSYAMMNDGENGAKTMTTWTDADRICLIVTAEVRAQIDVDVLATSFNMDRSDFLGKIIEVDSFTHPEIQAILCDESYLQIYDNVLKFTEFNNARTMTWNYYLHAWNTFAICPFANAIIFATSETPEEPITP